MAGKKIHEDLFRLRLFYKLYREFLDVHFSGYTINSGDEINHQYLQLCLKIEDILKNPELSDFNSDWKPIDNLLDYDQDYPEGDWEYGGRQTCANFANKIEKIFIEKGQKKYSLKGSDIDLLNNTREFIDKYQASKKISDKKFSEYAETEGKKFQEKHSNKESLSMNQGKKTNHLIIYPFIVWAVVGIIFAFLNYGGVFITIYDETIPISKEYMVYTQNPANLDGDKLVLTGEISGMSLKGNIVIQSTLFSAQNPIDVKIELSPTTVLDIDDEKILKLLPDPFAVFFIGASNVNDKTDETFNLAKIYLKKSLEAKKLVGSGTLVYSQSGNHEIYFLDPREQSLMLDLLNEGQPPGKTIFLPSPQQSLQNKELIIDEGSGKILSKTELNSENNPYSIEIKQSDALNSLESSKNTAIATWLALAFGPFAFIPFINKKTFSKR